MRWFVRGDVLWNVLSVVLPMGIFNVVASIQNLDSAEAAGDCYATVPSLTANGIGTGCAALFGSHGPGRSATAAWRCSSTWRAG
jgi:AGZA family xanthine/uracil permease-like MFS transporter